MDVLNPIQGHVAAMEPALDERGDPAAARLPGAGGRAAMEPALDERGDVVVAHGSRQCLRPQWSPLSTSGATRVPPAPRSPSARRNGARSRRAGRRGDRAKVVTGLGAAMEPALDERGDDETRADVRGVVVAAMEPALDERGDRPTSSLTTEVCVPQWSPLSTSGATGGGGPSTLEQ